MTCQMQKGVTYGAKRDEPASPAGEMSRMMRNRVGRPEMGGSRDVLIRGCSGANHRGDEEGLISRPRVLLRRRAVTHKIVEWRELYWTRFTRKGRAGAKKFVDSTDPRTLEP